MNELNHPQNTESAAPSLTNTTPKAPRKEFSPALPNPAMPKGSKSAPSDASDNAVGSSERDPLSTAVTNLFENPPPVLDEALGQIRGYVERVNEFVQKRPLTVLSAACAVGMAAAFVLSSRETRTETEE